MGIDRIDNAKGYIEGNVTSCCKTCNMIKSVYSVDNFIEYCKNIYDNFRTDKISGIELMQTNYSAYIYQCGERKVKFDLSKNEYCEFRKKNCYYCNNTNDLNRIGIDRVNPDLGYVKSNELVSCCYICNMMKKDLYIHDFYNQILRILKHKNIINEITYNKKIMHVDNSKISIINNIKYALNYEDNQKDIMNREYAVSLDHKSDWYIKRIWEGVNVNDFYPEIEICTTLEQIDIWSYFRFTFNSIIRDEQNYSDIKILVRDIYSKKYVGFAKIDLERSDEICKYLDIKLSNQSDIVCVIKMCTALPYFAYNFDGDKLMIKLMWSNEIIDICKKIYKKNIIGMVLYSPHGRNEKYTEIDDLEYVCLSNSTNRKCTRISSNIRRNVKKILINDKVDISKCNTVTDHVSLFCRLYNLDNAIYEDFRYGIYFNRIDDSKSRQSMDDIINKWCILDGIRRFEKLLHLKQLNFCYNYDQYYVDDKAYVKQDKYDYDKDKHNKINFDKNKILFVWYPNKYKFTIEEVTNQLKDKNLMSQIIYNLNNNQYIIPDELKEFHNNHLSILSSIISKIENERKLRYINKYIDENISKLIEYDKNKELLKNGMLFNVDFDTFYFLKRNNDIIIQTDFKIENIHNGLWIIIEVDKLKDDLIFEMKYSKYDEKLSDNISHGNDIFNNGVYNMNVISLSKHRIDVSDTKLVNLNAPYKALYDSIYINNRNRSKYLQIDLTFKKQKL